MSNKKLIYIFLLILPILDLFTSLTTRLMITSLSIGVIVKTLFLGIMVLYLIFKSTSKHKKISLIYLGIIFLYVVGYLITKLKYLNLLTFITECTYLIKLLFYPILLVCLYCYFDDKNFSKKEINKVLVFNLLTYIVLLLIPLLTKTSFDTYSYGLEGYTGWYYAANEISIILILLFPFVYSLLHKKSILWLIIPFIVILTISTIGTKASMLGIILDSLIVLILTIFYKKDKKVNKKAIIYTFILFLFIISIFSNSSSLTNFKVTLGIQQVQNLEINQERIKERALLNDEIKKIEKEEEEKLEESITNNTTNKEPDNKTEQEKETAIEKFLDKYGRAILSDRDLYVEVSYKLYKNNYDINTLLFGLGYTNNVKYHSYAIEKLIEIDPLDIFFHSGLIALLIIMLPFIYYAYKLIRNKKITTFIAFNTLMLGMILCVSCISGHTLMAPAVSIYVVLYFILAYYELGLISSKKEDIVKGKISIYALHLNYGGIEKNICTKANILSKAYDVEIISLYKLTNKPVFKINKNVKVKYLTENIKPNREEFKKSLKSKNIFEILKEGFYALKVLYLKNNLLVKSIIKCNSEIIISTRMDFTKKLIKNNDYKNIKIAEEHVYHNNKDKYLLDIYKVLKNIDYLMPSSNYLTKYYKEEFPKYSYKIVTNEMPIETNGNVSNLKNKTLITVGRLDKVKGYSDLINIFKKINNKEWTLNIVGDGPEYNNLMKQIKELNLTGNVKLLGKKNTDELNKLYEEASIYVMTSFEESFGLVLLEAASHGLPIIAYSSALGAKEILDNNNDILIDDRNESEMIKKLEELMENLKLRKQQQKYSLKLYEKYDYKIIEKNNLNFYKKIDKTNIFNNLYSNSKSECYKLIKDKLNKKEKTFIITANPETYMISTKDLEMSNMIYNEKNLIVPDGIAVVKTTKFLGNKIKERISGIDIAEYLLELANINKYKVYLFGATEEVMDKLEIVIKNKYPNIKLVGASNGYIKDKDAVMNYIKSTNPDIVLVALGIPMQEKLINKHINDFKKGIFVGVGGSFDVLSGTKNRAPKIFIKLNLEWLYRIAKEPKRIPRFIKHNIRFLFRVFEEKNNR